MPKPGLTLEKIKQTSPKLNPGKVIRADDVLTDAEKEKVQRRRVQGNIKKRNFDDVDSLIAEIIARFGYDAYKAFNSGEIPSEKMYRFIYAERAREASSKLNLYGIIISLVSSLIKREKGKPAPKGPKIAQKIFENERKIAEGES